MTTSSTGIHCLCPGARSARETADSASASLVASFFWSNPGRAAILRRTASAHQPAIGTVRRRRSLALSFSSDTTSTVSSTSIVHSATHLDAPLLSVQSHGVTLQSHQRVRHWRELKGVSQLELATRAKMDNSKLCRIESGEIQARAADIERLAKALNLTMPEFYGEIAA